MPKLREQKLTPELLAQYKTMGSCLKVGMELWMIDGKKLSIGEVVKIEPDRGVHIKLANGSTVFRTPTESILMAEVPKRVQRELKKQQVTP